MGFSCLSSITWDWSPGSSGVSVGESSVWRAGRGIGVGRAKPGLKVSWAAYASVLKVLRKGHKGNGVDGETDEEREEDSTGMAGQEQPCRVHNPGFFRSVSGGRMESVAESIR